MASINGYPHLEMHVRDDSIYIPSTSEILPISRPLYMMKAARGPIGRPVWCPTYSDAVRIFGADTFNKRSKYYSQNSYFLYKQFQMGSGAFIMRVAGSEATNCSVSIEIGLSKETIDANSNLPNADIPQFQRDSNGNFVLELTGAKIPINSEGLTRAELEERNARIEEGTETGDIKEFVQATIKGYKIAWRATIRPNSTDTRPIGSNATSESENFIWYPLVDILAANPGAWGSCYGIKLFFDPSVNTIAGTISNGAATYSFTPVELLQDATAPTSIIDKFGTDTVTGVIKPDVVDADTEVDLTLKARVMNAYSESHALPLQFTYLSENWNIVGKKIMLAELAARESVAAMYKNLEQVVLGTVASTTYSPTEDLVRDRTKIYYVLSDSEYVKAMADAFDASGEFVEGTTYFEKDPDTIITGVRTFVDDLLGEAPLLTDGTKGDFEAANAEKIGGDDSTVGYMANIVGCVDPNGVPYFASQILEAADAWVTTDSLVNKNDVIVPSSDQSIFLGGGLDGELNDWNIEEYIRQQIRAAIAGSQDYLNDYWRCPFNFIFDTGYSIKTKKALIDFTAARDDIIAVISSQVTWKKDASDINDPVPNSRMDDESIAAALRAYALLFKEDVQNATGACRVIIFCHAGKTSDFDDKWLPYTLWYALKTAEYLKKPFLDQEPKGLIANRSAVECFTETSWVAAQEETKSRVWNSGVNYVQHYGMGDNEIHFAAVRSVYWYETSVLVDAGFITALCETKHLTRKSWSKFAGMTLPAAEINKLITEDIASSLDYMLNNKYKHDQRVFQTTEDVNLGYARHVDISLEAAGQNRVWNVTIACKREGFNPDEAAA